MSDISAGGSGGPGVPSSIDRLDAAWVEAALRSGAGGPRQDAGRHSDGSIRVLKVDVERLAAGKSFLGTLARLVVTFEPNADGSEPSPANYICKLPAEDQGSMAVATLLGAYEREARFYAELANDIGVPVPRCRYQSIEESGGRSVVLLDDLTATARAADQIEGASDGDADSVIDMMAALHGRWWNVPRGPFPEWIPGIDRGEIGRLAGAIGAAQPNFVARWHQHIDPITIGWLEQIIPRLQGILDEMAGHGLTMAHADVHLGNILFAPASTGDLDAERNGADQDSADQDGADENGAPSTAVLLDWQTAMRTHGMTDFSFFVATNLTVEDRRRREGDLLRRYCDQLARHGVSLAPAEAMELHRRSLMWWMAMLSNNLATIEPADERGQKLFTAIVARTFTAAVDHEVGQDL